MEVDQSAIRILAVKVGPNAISNWQPAVAFQCLWANLYSIMRVYYSLNVSTKLVNIMQYLASVLKSAEVS